MSFKRLPLVCLFFVIMLTVTPVSAQASDSSGEQEPSAKAIQKAKIDPAFNTTIGTTGMVGDVVAVGEKLLVYYSTSVESTVSRLLPNGAVDSSFQVATLTYNKLVQARGHLTLLPNGKILVAGNFKAVNGVTRGGLARLNSDGSLDNSFVAAIDNVKRIALLPDGKILAGTKAYGNGTAPASLVRLNPDGTLDASFSQVTLASVAASSSFGPVDPYVEALRVQPDGKILVGGHFALVNGEANHNNLVRLNANGTLDSTFVATGTLYGGTAGNKYYAPIYDILLIPGNKIMIGGGFTSINGVSRVALALLNPNGSLDESFGKLLQNPNRARACVFALIINDGKVLVGGNYLLTTDNLHPNFFRVSFTGKLDTASVIRFSKDNDYREGMVSALAVPPSGRVVIGGAFNGIFDGSSKKFELQNLVRIIFPKSGSLGKN